MLDLFENVFYAVKPITSKVQLSFPLCPHEVRALEREDSLYDGKSINSDREIQYFRFTQPVIESYAPCSKEKEHQLVVQGVENYSIMF